MDNRYAVIENGVVANVVVADAEFAASQGWVACPHASPGWLYTNGVFSEPIKPATPDPEPAPTPAPTKEQLMAELAALTAKIQALE